VGTRARRRPPAALCSSEPADLARRLLAGDEVLFQGLVAQLHPSLRRLAQAIVGNAATADEVAQETWKAVLRSLRGFQGRSTLRTWIHRVCVNVALARAGEDLRWPLLDAGVVDAQAFDDRGGWREPPEPWIDETPESLLLRRELAESIRRAVESLPATQRAVIVLRDVEGLTAGEACEILGLTEGNQRVLLHRARQRVRRSCQHFHRTQSAAARPASGEAQEPGRVRSAA
jgi:RNA polymerase sigma-70 factor, ECF subfamily